MKFDKDKFIQTFVVMRYIISCIYFQSIHWQVQNNTEQTKRSHERDKALWPQAQCDRRVRRLPKRAVPGLQAALMEAQCPDNSSTVLSSHPTESDGGSPVLAPRFKRRADKQTLS